MSPGMNIKTKICKAVFREMSLIFLLIIPALAGNGQQVKLRAQLEADSILIGDQIRYLLEIEQPADLKVLFPQLGDTLIPGIEILSRSERDTQQVDQDRLYLKQSFLITSFDSGYYRIPGQAFLIRSDKDEELAYTNPLDLRVLTMKLDTANAIFDIKMPYGAPVRISDILPYVLAALLAAAIVMLIVRFVRNRKRRKQGYVPSIPKEPAHIIAIRSLNKLKEEKLWQNNRVKLYYIKLTGIIRKYLEQRYYVRAMEETTAEILEDMKNSGFNDNRLFEKLKSLLDLADLAKFAKPIQCSVVLYTCRHTIVA